MFFFINISGLVFAMCLIFHDKLEGEGVRRKETARRPDNPDILLKEIWDTRDLGLAKRE